VLPAQPVLLQPTFAKPDKPDFVVKTATIANTFSETAQHLGISEPMTTSLSEAFSGNFDFRRDLRKGDNVSFVFQEADPDGLSATTRPLPVAAKISSDTIVHEFFLYRNLNGKTFYYAQDGSPTRPFFHVIHSPLRASRRTSPLTGSIR
jgi:hypothetical protein